MSSLKSPNIELREDESIDAFMDGRLKLIQSKKGYRFSIDAILLSEFVSIKPGDVIVDLGTGCGIIPLVLLLRSSVAYAYGLEIQQVLANQAVRNAALNGFEKKMGVILGDIRHPPFMRASADVVICNPPYRRREAGRINPDPQRAIARHEIHTSLDDILDTARRLLKPKGRLAMVYPASRLVDIIVTLRGFNLEPKRVQVIYPDLKSEAKLVLIEAAAEGRGGLKLLEPLIDQGEFSV
jgi:tRNA1Val (adenine37-N6)-methyltransferase